MKSILDKRLAKVEGNPCRNLIMEVRDAMGYEELAADIATVRFTLSW